MKKIILQGLRLGQKVSKGLRAAYETVTGRLRDDKPCNMSGARVAREAIEAHRRVSGGQSRSKCAAQVRKANIELLKAEWLKYAAMLVMLFTIGSGNVWATTFTTTTSGGFSNGSKTIDGITVTFSNGPSWQTGHVRVYQGNTISFSCSSAITSIEMSCTQGARNFNASVGSCSTSGSTITWTGSGNNITLTLPNGSQVRITQIVVTAGGSTKTLSSIAITTQPTRRKYVVGETFSSSGAVVTATYSDASTKSVSATWTPTSALTVGAGKTVTASYTEGGTTKTATTTIDVYSITLNAKDESNNVLSSLVVTQPTQSGSSLTAASSGNSYTFKQWSVSGVTLSDNTSTTPTITAVTGAVTATAVYYAPITVEWYAGGTKIDDETHARGWSLMYPSNPDPASYGCTGKVFYGWTTEANKNYEHATVAPSLVSSGTAINENSKFYAVFAESSGGGGVTTTWVKTALNSVNEGIYALATTDGHAFNGTMDSNHHGQVTAQAFSFTDGVATSAPAGTCEITFTAVTGGFTMYNATYGYLYANAAATKNLYWHATETSYWKYASSNWTYNANSAFLRSYSNNSLRTYGANNGDVLVLVKKTTSGSEPTYTNFATSCGCEEYSFHTGSSADETLKTTNTQTCFENHPSDANQRIISDYVIPSDTKFFVGKLGYFYNSNLNISGTGSQSVIKQFGAANADNGLYLNYTKGYGDGSRPGVGQATGAIGTLYIDVTSTWHNLHLGFDPNGYIFKLGSTYLTMHNATSGLDATRYKETDVVTLSSTNISGQFQVNIAAVAPNASTGVACAYTETKNLTTMGVKSGSGNSWRGTSINAGADTDTKGFFRIDIGEGNATNWNAHWVPCWELKFDYKGGSGSISTTPAYVSVEGDAAARTVTIPNTAPTKDGYRFMGWSDDDNNTVEYAAGSTHNVTLSGNKTVYAVWKQVYTVTYAYAGGSGSCAGGSYAAGETVTTCATATKAGSTLTGWRRSDNDATVTPGNTFAMPASNVTLTAVWADTEYSLTQNVGSHTTKGHTGTAITSGMTSPSGLDLTYTISDNAYALPKAVTISGGGQTWTLGTNYTWSLSEDKHSATLHLGSNLTISANVTITVTEQARYTVIWDEHGSTTTEYYAADDNTVVEKTGIADCGTKKFALWTENSIFTEHATTPPAKVTFGTISGDKHYYAIYGTATGTGGYSKVTTVEEGEAYLLVATGQSLAYAGKMDGKDKGDKVSVTISEGIITDKNGAHEVRIIGTSSSFQIYDIDAEVYVKSSGTSSTDLSIDVTTPSTDSHLWVIDSEMARSKATSGSDSRYFAYNTASPYCFGHYKNPANDVKTYFYKYTAGFKDYSKTCVQYDINIAATSDGTLTTTPADEAGSGATVTVNVTPNSCKYLSALKYNDGSDHAISIASTPYTFTMPAADVTVTATFADKSVSSIAANTAIHRTLMQGTAFEGEQIRVTYNNGETEDLAWNDASLTFSGYNMSTLGEQTVSVAYSGSCGSANTSYSIEITDGIPVTFSDCGITTVHKYDPGDVVPVETTAGEYACSGWEFVGWSESSVTANSTSFTPVRNFTASIAKTLYAVYAHQGDNFISAKLTNELHEGARYILAYYVNNNNTSYGLTGLLPTVKNTNYLQGTHVGNSGIAYTETNVGGLYQYTLTSYTPVSGVLWQLQADGTGYWQLYNIAQRKYLNLSSYSDGYVSVSTSPVGKLVLEDEDANPAYCNGSRVYVKYNGGTKRLAWNRNSGDGYWNQHTSGYQFFLTKDEYFSSMPPCAPLSAIFHGNGGTVIADGGSQTGANLTIAETTRDDGITTPTAEMDEEDCEGKVWSFIGWSAAEIDLTRKPVLTTDLLNDGGGNKHHTITNDGEEFWAVYTNTGPAETLYGDITLTKDDLPSKQYNTSEETITKSGITFGTINTGYQSDNGLQFKENEGVLYNKTSLGKINSIRLGYFVANTIANVKVYVGNSADVVTTELTSSQRQDLGTGIGATYTYYPPDDYAYFKVVSSGSYFVVSSIRIDYGKGTQVWATSPDCSNLILSGDIKITSAQNQSVKSLNKLTVTASGQAVNTPVVIKAYNLSDDTENTKITFESISTDATGAIDQQIDVIYRPTETTDGIEDVYIRATIGEKESNKLPAQVRHLPEKFVIAARVGDVWMALPADISAGVHEGVPVKVDNIDNPTNAIVTMNTTGYRLQGLPSNQPSVADNRFKYNGAATYLVSTVTSKALRTSNAKVANSDAKNIGTRATTVMHGPDSLFYEWKLETTDLQTYQLVNSRKKDSENNDYTTHTLFYSQTAAKWGLYADASANRNIQDLRLLPIVTELAELNIEVMEWSASAIALRIPSMTDITDSRLNISFGDKQKNSVTLTNINDGSGGTSDLYKAEGLTVDTRTLADYPCQLLTLQNTAGTHGTMMRLPVMISSASQTTSGVRTLLGGDADNCDVCPTCDVVILNGGKLTSNDAKPSIKTYVSNLFVYPGGKIEVNGTGLGVIKQFYLRGGFSFLNSTFAMPNAYINNSNFTGTNNALFDYYIDNRKFYWLSLPYDVKLDDVSDEVGYKNFSSWVAYYDGAARAVGAHTTGWKDYDGVDDTYFGNAGTSGTLTDDYFKTGYGYNISAKPRKKYNGAPDIARYRPYAIVRFPLGNKTFNSSNGGEESSTVKSYEVTVTAHGIKELNEGTQTANNVGWNLVGNPYMSAIGGAAADGATSGDANITVGRLVETKPDGVHWDGTYHWEDEAIRYVTLPNLIYDEYTQVKLSEATIPAFTSFFIQTKTPGTLSFSADARRQLMPKLQAHSEEQEMSIDLVLEHEDKSDLTGILFAEHFTEDYEIGADLEKMAGDNQMTLYSLTSGYELAFNALPEQRAAEPLPLGFTAAEDGEYTIRLKESADTRFVESIILIDYEQGGQLTDLMVDDYTFDAVAQKHNNTRFALSVRMRQNGDIGTSAEQLTGALSAVSTTSRDGTLVLHSLPANTQVFVYDMTGKLITTTNTTTASERLTYELPRGVYNIRVIQGTEGRTIRVRVE